MFARLANGIIKHHKKVIVAWAIVLVLAIPPMLMVSDVVIYQEIEAAPMNIESQKAQDLIDENFAMANSTTIVVIQHENIVSEEMRDFVLMLESDVRQAASNGQIQYFGNFTSIYTLYQGILVMVAGELSPTLYELEDGTNYTSAMVYSGPVFYVSAWGNNPVNFTVFNNSWNLYSTPITDPMERQMVYGYHYQYWMTWNMSFAAQPTLSAMERSQYSVDSTVPVYFPSLPIDNETRDMTLAVWQAFNMTTWSDPAYIHSFTVNMVATMFAELTGIPFQPSFTGFVEDIYSLGEDPAPQTLAAFSTSVVQNGTLDTYAFQLPSEFMSTFVNTPANDTMLVMITFTRDSAYAEEGGGKPVMDNVGIVRSLVKDLKMETGTDAKTYVSGDAALSFDMEEAANEDLKRIDPITVIIIIVLIGAFFRSVVSPWVPLGTIGVAIVATQGIIYLVGKYVAGIHYSVLTLLFVIIMSVGADYAIFIMARYKEERRKGASREEGVRTSVTWAGESIATSGATVMLGFGAISIIDYPLLRTMGITLALGVGIALLVALTLLPSIMLLMGNRIFWPSMKANKEGAKNVNKNPGRKNSGKKAEKMGYFERSARFSVKHSKAIVIAALLISVPTTFAALTMATSFDMIAGLPDVESKLGIDAMAEGFGAGSVMQTYIVVQLGSEIHTNGTFDNDLLDSIEYVCFRAESLGNVRRITSPTRPMGDLIDYRDLDSIPGIEKDTYVGMMLQTIGADNRTVLITVILEEEPYTDRSLKTIEAFREETRFLKEEDTNPNATALKDSRMHVGGATASILDIRDMMNVEFTKMAAVVLVGVFIILLIVLGSVLIPLRLILTIALSISWTIAATLIVFQFIIGLPVMWMTPLILFVVLMGLGMDYDIFLVTRIREEVAKGKSDKDAIITAVEKTGGVITACGLIMAGAFGSMMLSSMALLQEFGFALAFAILLDAMIVRIYLVPAIMVLLEKWNWWAPGRLQRVRREEKMRRKSEKK